MGNATGAGDTTGAGDATSAGDAAGLDDAVAVGFVLQPTNVVRQARPRARWMENDLFIFSSFVFAGDYNHGWSSCKEAKNNWRDGVMGVKSADYLCPNSPSLRHSILPASVMPAAATVIATVIATPTAAVITAVITAAESE